MIDNINISPEAVMRELDSYRAAIRDAFDEGFALSKFGGPIEKSWERSEARQTDYAFAHTRMSLLEIQGWESSNQPAVVRASGQYLADGLERRGEYGWLPPHVWLQPLFVHP